MPTRRRADEARPMFTTLIPDAAGAPPTEPADDRRRFLRLLETAVTTATLQRLQLSQFRGGRAAEPDLQRLLVRPVRLKGEAMLQFVWRHTTRDITKNHAPADGLALLDAQIGHAFGHAHLDTTTHEVQLHAKPKGGALKFRLQVGKRPAPTPAADAAADATEAANAGRADDALAHNRAKQRLLDLARPHWVDLGVTSPGGQLLPSMASKWKQINRFTEIFSAALARSPLAAADTVRVVDFGCGKAYLTFAVHEWLAGSGHRPEVTGVELRRDLVELCNRSAQAHGLAGLRFDAGDVRDYAPPAIDVMIALHACDTATDHAIDLGLRAGAAVILCSPCCHKELRPQLRSPALLKPLLQHGVHLGQEAEMVTDGLRALLLDAAGYDTQVFEFVSQSHTNKNKMILAVRRPREQPGHAEAVRAQIAAIKDFYGIREQTLERLVSA
jgi:SAM-dependent methyltransferase